MSRTEWINAFTDELQKLRPHLAPGFGTSRIVQDLASYTYANGGMREDPAAAARKYHDREANKWKQ